MTCLRIAARRPLYLDAATSSPACPFSPPAPLAQLTSPPNIGSTPLLSYRQHQPKVCRVQQLLRCHAVFGSMPASGRPCPLLLVQGVDQANGLVSAGMHMYAVRTYASSYTCADSTRLAGTASPTPANPVPFRSTRTNIHAVTGSLARGRDLPSPRGQDGDFHTHFPATACKRNTGLC